MSDDIAINVSEALNRVTDPELRDIACRKIVAHAINQVRAATIEECAMAYKELGAKWRREAEHYKKEARAAADADDGHEYDLAKEIAHQLTRCANDLDRALKEQLK